MQFVDRADAGRWLAARLERLRIKDAVVLAIPRGGVFVGYEIARVLDAPLDVAGPPTGRRAQKYRHGQQPVSVAGKSVVVVDDGLESPNTALVAVAAAKEAKPAHLVFATPVCPLGLAGALRREVDELVALNLPDEIGPAGRWYAHLPSLTEADVSDRLDAARAERQAVLWF